MEKCVCKTEKVIHRQPGEKSLKIGYTQSYPHYPQWMKVIHSVKAFQIENGCFVQKAENGQK
jgi:hypothetical protein